MDTDFVLLAEKDAMWAQMLVDVLKDNRIPCVTQGVHGAGFTTKTGIPERLKIFVPAQFREQAEDLFHQLFPAEST